MVRSLRIALYILGLVQFVFLTSCGLVEKCQKDFYFMGSVSDNSGNPISDVQVTVGNDSLGWGSLGKTGDDGKYSYTSLKTRTWYSGQSVVFSKTGYQSLVTPPFSETESGPDICGTVNLRRNGNLISQ